MLPENRRGVSRNEKIPLLPGFQMSSDLKAPGRWRIIMITKNGFVILDP
jgi:hypothetical protein